MDLFVHEDLDYASRLIAAGVPTQISVVPGRVHAFESIVPDSTETRQYLQQLDAAIQGMLAGKNTAHP